MGNSEEVRFFRDHIICYYDFVIYFPFSFKSHIISYLYTFYCPSPPSPHPSAAAVRSREDYALSKKNVGGKIHIPTYDVLTHLNPQTSQKRLSQVCHHSTNGNCQI